jgi:hypothetical protein
VFFSLMIAGLAGSLPSTMASGLRAHGVPHAAAAQISSLPPVSSLFASVLGVNPVQHLLSDAGVLARLPAASQRVLTGREFFPGLISGPVHHGLAVVFTVSAALAVLAGLASLLRGGRYVMPEPSAGPARLGAAEPTVSTGNGQATSGAHLAADDGSRPADGTGPAAGSRYSGGNGSVASAQEDDRSAGRG